MSAGERKRATAGLMSFEMVARQGQFREHFALMGADDQRAMLESPFAAGEEIAGAAAFRRDRALSGTGRMSKIHKTGAASRGGEPPAAVKFDRRRLRRRWRGRRRRDLRWRLGPVGAAA